MKQWAKDTRCWVPAIFLSKWQLTISVGPFRRRAVPFHFCQTQARKYSPHWIFLAVEYRFLLQHFIVAPPLHCKRMYPWKLFKSQNQILTSRGSKLTAMLMTPDATCFKWPQSNHVFRSRKTKVQAQKARSPSFYPTQILQHRILKFKWTPQSWMENEDKETRQMAGRPPSPHVVNQSTAPSSNF